MQLSLPSKTHSTVHVQQRSSKPDRTGKWLMAFVLIFLLCVALSACSASKPSPPPDVGMVLQPNKVDPGPLPALVADTQPLPAGYFQRRRLEREMSKSPKTTTPTTPTGSISPTPSAAQTR